MSRVSAIPSCSLWTGIRISFLLYIALFFARRLLTDYQCDVEVRRKESPRHEAVKESQGCRV